MLTYGTDTTTSTYNQLPLSPSHRYISTKQGRCTNCGPTYQRAKQIQGLLNPRKSRGYLQVARAYLQPYTQLHAGTHAGTPAGGTHFRYTNTNSFTSPKVVETYVMASTDPCPTGKRTKSTHLPRMVALEGNRHSSYKIKWTRIHSLPEPCPHPLGRRRRTSIISALLHKKLRHRLHAENEIQWGNDTWYAQT